MKRQHSYRSAAVFAGVLALVFPVFAGFGVSSVFVPAGEAWASTSVNATVFRSSSLCSRGDIQYISYYDAEGWLVLGRRVISSGEPFTTRRTPYRGNVRDAHNSISMAVDGDGFLHVSFDHHGAPLKYARSVAPDALELGPLEPMTGSGEGNVTYPEFHRLADGELVFVFRDGMSGSGNLVMNRYSTKEGRWTRLHDSLIDGEGRENPYWQMCTDSAGVIHLSWVWRRTPDVATNHDLCYARSRDGGVSWERTDGTPYALPITAATAEYALRIPERSELINQTGMAADAASHPAIATYWREKGDMAVQYRLVRHDGKGWRVLRLPERTLDFRLAGGGTKAIPVSRPRIVTDGSFAAVLFRDAERGSRASAYVTDDIDSGDWRTVDFSEEPLGAWEPSIDDDLWRERRHLHLYFQPVRQGVGERSLDGAPTKAGALEVRWRQIGCVVAGEWRDRP